MTEYRFSPIKNKEQLLKAIDYTHKKCSELVKNNFGRYLPSAGNIGIFCHYDDEYKFLTELREELTQKLDNWNKKYYRLHEPISVSGQGDIPGAIYSYLYIRHPDDHHEVGDVDFVLNSEEYNKLKNSLLDGNKIKGIKIFDRPGIDLVKLSDQDFDVLSFIGTKDMAENMKRIN